MNIELRKVKQQCVRDKCVDLFIKSGADVNKQNKDGQTALMLAARGGHDKCVDLLIQAGADVNKQNKDGHTVLEVAVRYSHKKSVKQCLKGGAQVNVVNIIGVNMLSKFMIPFFDRNPRKEIIKLLCAAGETKDETKVPYFVKPLQLNLKHMCRQTIRKHLKNLNPHQHLFGRIPQLGLPSSLTKYLLFYMSLADDDDDDDDDNAPCFIKKLIL